ncbi:HAMP domain-containing histidine kinase, partial [bacterium]|nr:HAMP domain-containing histidine kinase [bacterium]
KALVLTLVLAGIMWIADSILDYVIFYEGTFLDLLILAVPPHELYIRSLFSFAFLIFGVMMRNILNRLALQEQERNRIELELELYLSVVSHDLRNELSIISLNIDAITLGNLDTKEEELDLNIRSKAACKRMTALLKAIGNPSKEVETNLPYLIGHVASDIMSVYPKLTISIENQEKIQFLGSRLLHLVFDNLFRNSAIHVGESAIIEVNITSQNNYAQVLISDNGPGIAEEIKDRIFQRGVSTSGTGLGLYISREILKSLGGTIELVNTDTSKGAVFKIIIPIIA